MSKDWLLEDEDDIFTGSAKSKYFDVVKQANEHIVQDEFDKFLEKVAVMQVLLSKNKSEDFDIDDIVKQYTFENLDEIKNIKKGLYIELTGDIICRLDS